MSHKVLQIVLVLLLTLFSSTHNSNGNFLMEEAAAAGLNGYCLLTNTTKHSYGQAFNNTPVPIKNSSFSFNIIFGIVPEHKQQGSHGMAFVFSPTRGLPGASPDQYLGIFNETNNGKASNNVIAIELDIRKDEEFGDIDDNHVGININGLTSVASASAGYYDDEDGNFKKLSLISTKVMRLSIVYSHTDKQLNVTLLPAEISVPPQKSLLSLNRDLSPYFLEETYLGFTASTGSIGALYYVMQFSYEEGVIYPAWDLGVIPTLPPYPKKSYDRTRRILAVCLTLAVFTALVASGIGFVFYVRHKKVKEVLEEWEIQNGPHRFSYKELFNATKGFKEKQLLGKGGFGQVYKGMLPGSDAEIAVKRTSHDSRQGMSEFLAEISTIGRLRHPNLVRLLGYCKHKENLYLVYDFMPNGSLDRCLTRSNTNENQERLTWEQRFKIIKDVATALLHLHQEWVQVIVHRDIKPANVLLDHGMNARLGDFGLAKLYDQGFDPQTSRVAGTLGYIAPELLRTGRATTSTDVYAFGLVMLEVVCGRRLIERRAAENEAVLVDWILELWESGKLFDAAEESIRQEQNRGEIELVLKLGLLCAHHTELIRPNMSAVLQILNGVSHLPNNLLDVVRAERLRGIPETSMEVLLGLDLNSFGTMTLTNSFVSHGR
ncbi:Concanavalin A-like lectin protein kinase family protein [Arabidopsis thaliana]|uniref:L-type lectin-domain containing receptor kinase V.7 n=1 Tax=Arabidopsis thaliana TaxID=3702 RepID=LRK57_ARATH|nr:Concanavalin A-like lectin protein kinase family protein [Arabidopsis thaliana]Q9ZR79.2 RecName: Full=L-type lectin-domain containing receptor kinase V.7; Short=Arabidopsis thaliana lectin-receptor kinase a3; Short=AthlecRK-a3; Short=LecRK-V.7; Flags: Precursor [Arabidopsis thaliana]AEE79960.1 Concanavalin A-like lectin protein kinase family protein [Arabidopsis thaliana]|eukprot:NP_191533.1 Concanavalin A-like lectin protein kinase family protein [Arabidopsis thaliana]